MLRNCSLASSAPAFLLCITPSWAGATVFQCSDPEGLLILVHTFQQSNCCGKRPEFHSLAPHLLLAPFWDVNIINFCALLTLTTNQSLGLNVKAYLFCEETPVFPTLICRVWKDTWESTTLLTLFLLVFPSGCCVTACWFCRFKLR